MLRPNCAFTPGVPPTVDQGTILTVTVDVHNLGVRPALGGYVAISVPAGLGTLLTPVTQFFTTPLGPGASDSVSWQVNVTGTGVYTLSFTAGYGGLPGTTYSDAFLGDTNSTGVFDVSASFTPGTTVTQGDTITVQLTVRDAAGNQITDATIDATIGSTTITFTHTGSGVYEGTIDTSSLTPATYTLSVDISKANFHTYSHGYTITVQSGTTTTTTTTLPPPPIPGFPLEAIAAGAALGLGLVLVLRRRRKHIE